MFPIKTVVSITTACTAVQPWLINRAFWLLNTSLTLNRPRMNTVGYHINRNFLHVEIPDLLAHPVADLEGGVGGGSESATGHTDTYFDAPMYIRRWRVKAPSFYLHQALRDFPHSSEIISKITALVVEKGEPRRHALSRAWPTNRGISTQTHQ